MKVTVKTDFFDLKEDKFRKAGEVFEVTKARFEQVKDFVEDAKS